MNRNIPSADTNSIAAVFSDLFAFKLAVIQDFFRSVISLVVSGALEAISINRKV